MSMESTGIELYRVSKDSNSKGGVPIVKGVNRNGVIPTVKEVKQGRSYIECQRGRSYTEMQRG